MRERGIYKYLYFLCIDRVCVGLFARKRVHENDGNHYHMCVCTNNSRSILCWMLDQVPLQLEGRITTYTETPQTLVTE